MDTRRGEPRLDRIVVPTTAERESSFRLSLGKLAQNVIRAEPFRPVLVLGPQRSGKTTGIVIPAILEWQGPAVVTSVRYDVLSETLRYRSSLGKTMIFDPSGLIPPGGFGGALLGWNPLSGIERWDDAVRLAAGFCEGSSTSGLTDGGFWFTKARQLLSPLFFAAALSKESMGTVMKWLGLPSYELEREVGDVLKELARLDGKPDPSMRKLVETDPVFQSSPSSINFGKDDDDAAWAADRLSAACALDDRAFSSVQATATSVLEVFEYMSVERRCRAGEVTVTELLDGAVNTLYLCAPPKEQRLFRPMFSALVREVVDKAYSVNSLATADEMIPLLLCLDEAGNVARLDDLDNLATTAAGTRIQLLSVFHDLSQMQAAYGPDKSSLIVNNHSALLCLSGMRDPATSDLLSAILHDESVRGLDHFGWSTRDTRMIPRGRAVCVYEDLPALLMTLRRSFDDEILIDRIAVRKT